MPIITSTSKEARQKNIKTEIAAGKPIKQAVAIGYSEQRQAAKKRTSSTGFMPSRPKVGERRSSSDRPSHNR